ncbi:MAG TPA: deaminase [Patescibacteria group bacterium]|nr:deaminase [Patescibacteria group bacterium]
MTELEIFNHLFEISKQSDDKGGVVTSCLVRDGKIIASGISTNNGIHSEYALLQNLKSAGESILENDIVYTTVEPCGKRSPGGQGEKYGDCTTNLIQAGVKKVVYAAADPDASETTRHKFITAGSELTQVHDKQIIKWALEIFNSTVSGHHQALPEQD